MVQRLRVTTYNIHKGRGMDGRVRIARVAALLKEIDADVVALQEVVGHDDGPAERHQARFLAEALSYHWAVGETRKYRGGVYGNVTLSRIPFLYSRHFDLSVPRREPRGMLRTDIPVPNGILHVFNVHLGTSYFERRIQARRLLQEQPLRRPELTGARIVLGDFNEWMAGLVSRVLRTEFRRAELNARKPRGYPGFFPLLDLDHIYCDRNLCLDRAFFVRTPLSLVASDHLPLVADFTLDTPPGS